jgi:hypothetical protein
MAVPYYTSSTLVEAVQRRASVPINQSTFSSDDFLALANEEIQTIIVPLIMNMHEDYYSYPEVFPIISNQSRYPIPPRAIGQELRDAFYIDNGGNIRELTRLEEDDRAYYQNGGSNNYVGFYFEGNDMVMSPPIQQGATGNLLLVYYFRPNQLVDESRVGTVASTDHISRTITAIGLGSSPQITTSTANGLMVGDYIRLNQTNSVPSINGLYQVATVIDSLNFTVNVTTPVTIAASSMVSGYATPGKVFLTGPVPANITVGSLSDFIAGANGNSTKGYDAVVLSINGNELQFDPEKLPSTAYQANSIFGSPYHYEQDSGQFNQVLSSIVNYIPLLPGDFVSSAQETMVVQIPTDMQPMLAQTVVCRLLEAMGDTQGLTNANQKLAQIQSSMQSMLGNRILGAPKKINSRRTLIRYSRITFRRGSR